MTTIYADVAPPVKNAIWSFYISLISVADTDIFVVNPTIAAGDFKVSIDGGALNNLATLPVVTPAGSKILKITLSATEMNGSKVLIVGSDVAGAEWQDVMIMVSTESLGTLSQTASSAVAAMTGSDLAMVIGITYNTTISGLTIPATWTKVYLTIKENDADLDASSILQLVVSNPADALVDGVVYINKVAATVVTIAYGTLVVNQAAGTVAIMVMDEGDLLLPAGKYGYDLKCHLADGTKNQLSAGGECSIEYTETR